jgi:anti-anti-sigma factor
MTAQPHPFWFDVAPAGDVTIVRFTLDKIWRERTAEMLGEDLRGLVENGCRRLVLNFARVESVGSLMLDKLNELRQTMQTAGGQLVLCRLNPVLSETLTVTQLSQLFRICGEEQEALQALAPPPAAEPG